LAHFGLERVNAIDVLPPFHVSGLMARARCAETRGTHIPWDWKRLEMGERPVLDRREKWVISLVPTQLQRLIESADATAWLSGFEVVFLGGGPAWTELLDRAARAALRLALSYGMTETAAMVAAQRPEEFLAGDRSSGRALPHAMIDVTDEGSIRVGGASIFYGYFPEVREERAFTTADLGTIDAAGRLQVFGRSDAVIITGGEKVNPAEVEAVLRATGEFADVAVIGVPDPRWGEAVVACYPSGSRAPDLVAVERVVSDNLVSFKRPKRYFAIEAWPRNAQGKLRRGKLRDAVVGLLRTKSET
jgi:O-succinylbenzoic acid--CoA ligase